MNDSKKALERWETKIYVCNSEVIPLARWPIAKSLLKRDGPKASYAIHGSSGLKFNPLRKLTQLLTARKNSPHPMTCVTRTMKGG
jgi:hypothetical protein